MIIAWIIFAFGCLLLAWGLAKLAIQHARPDALMLFTGGAALLVLAFLYEVPF